jgi:hypothetical protein
MSEIGKEMEGRVFEVCQNGSKPSDFIIIIGETDKYFIYNKLQLELNKNNKVNDKLEVIKYRIIRTEPKNKRIKKFYSNYWCNIGLIKFDNNYKIGDFYYFNKYTF